MKAAVDRREAVDNAPPVGTPGPPDVNAVGRRAVDVEVLVRVVDTEGVGPLGRAGHRGRDTDKGQVSRESKVQRVAPDFPSGAQESGCGVGLFGRKPFEPRTTA